MNTPIDCPCGSGTEYSHCCSLFHSGDKNPATAEALMRSRFSAYALDDKTYIQATWDAAKRPDDNKLSNDNLVWQKLDIIDTKKGGVNDNKGIVEFKAFYLNNGGDYMLHEVSRFIKKDGRWFYVDGVVKKVGQIIQQENQGKNAPCPCGSGKKFKRCCGAG